MKEHKPSLITIVLAFLLGLNACDIVSIPTQETPIPGLAATLAIQTMCACPELSGLVFSPPPPRPSTSPMPMDGPGSTPPTIVMHTLAPTRTPAPMLTPFDSSSGCINAAEFIKDVTIPDNTLVKPKQKFTKVWRLKNVGTCTWTQEYTLIYVWGNQMNGQSPLRLGQTVDPGATIDLRVEMVAPGSYGLHQGDWMLMDEEGQKFGTGYKAREHFWVAINIKKPGMPSFYVSGGGC